jgi:NodT family efflux transporter outer membrane factor (OMF) lipoprotein
VVSLTSTPMMCAYLLKQQESHGRLYLITERAFQWVVDLYGRVLTVVLRHSFVTLLIFLFVVGLNAYLFVRVPKGFFPEQDTGRLNGSIQADQSTSFAQMDGILRKYVDIIDADPAIDTVNGFTGGGRGGASNSARLFISLKPVEQRKVTAGEIIMRLRPKLARVPGATLFLSASQDLRVGGRQSNAQYQYTLRGDNVQDLTAFSPRMLAALRKIPLITDVNSDEQNHGLQIYVQYDRATAARLGISSQLIDNTLYDAFGQRPVSTMYTSLNQYHVVMEAAPKYWRDPDILRQIFVISPSGQQVPLSAFARFAPDVAPLSIAHQGLFPSTTMSFNLNPGVALGDAVDAIEESARSIGLPAGIQTLFAGTAQAYQDSLGSEPLLIGAALLAVFIVLGVLYESLIHPMTILSTLPSAGVGALLALLATRTDLSIIAMIGIILLIGIVKKNAILMIDFALAAERNEGKSARDAIHEASLLRFRPILMTTMAALLGAVPLALGSGTGSELRRPLGITIIGGLIVSQMLTLFTTPVVYLYFDRLRLWRKRAANPETRRAGIALGVSILFVLLLPSCTVGPNYKRPTAPVPPAFKEQPPVNFKEAEAAGWRQSQPADSFEKGKWWEVYGDADLNALEEQVNISNQNVLQAEAQYRQAKAGVRLARAALFPTISTGPAISESRNAVGSANTSVGTGSRASFNLPLDVSWEPDIWGSIRRGVTASVTTAQSQAALLANARLLYQAELAQDYFALHGTDGEMDLLRRTEASYQEYLTLTRDRFAGGVASDLDVAQAETQLYGVQSDLIDLGVARAQYEHAIAVLTGKTPVELSIPPRPLTTPPPPVPFGLPSELLERRPDIAGAERRVAAANEEIGIAMAAFYPSFSVGASAGLQASSITKLFSWPSRFWSVGPQLAQTLFDAGRRRAVVAEQQAAYDATVASYRQTALTAIQQVEDDLAALRILEQEAAKVQQTVDSSGRALAVSTAQYRAGTASFLIVITSQAALLTSQRTAVTLLTRRLTASVLLIEALGGGWNASSLPERQELTHSPK